MTFSWIKKNKKLSCHVLKIWNVVFTISLFKCLLNFDNLTAILLETKKLGILWGFQKCATMQYKIWEKREWPNMSYLRGFLRFGGKGDEEKISNIFFIFKICNYNLFHLVWRFLKSRSPCCEIVLGKMQCAFNIHLFWQKEKQKYGSESLSSTVLC